MQLIRVFVVSMFVVIVFTGKGKESSSTENGDLALQKLSLSEFNMMYNFDGLSSRQFSYLRSEWFKWTRRLFNNVRTINEIMADVTCIVEWNYNYKNRFYIASKPRLQTALWFTLRYAFNPQRRMDFVELGKELPKEQQRAFQLLIRDLHNKPLKDDNVHFAEIDNAVKEKQELRKKFTKFVKGAYEAPNLGFLEEILAAHINKYEQKDLWVRSGDLHPNEFSDRYGAYEKLVNEFEAALKEKADTIKALFAKQESLLTRVYEGETGDVPKQGGKQAFKNLNPENGKSVEEIFAADSINKMVARFATFAIVEALDLFRAHPDRQYKYSVTPKKCGSVREKVGKDEFKEHFREPAEPANEFEPSQSVFMAWDEKRLRPVFAAPQIRSALTKMEAELPVLETQNFVVRRFALLAAEAQPQADTLLTGSGELHQSLGGAAASGKQGGSDAEEEYAGLAAASAVVYNGKRQVEVIGTHFKSKREGFEARKRLGEVLIDYIKETRSSEPAIDFVVMGDLNAEIDEIAYDLDSELVRFEQAYDDKNADLVGVFSPRSAAHIFEEKQALLTGKYFNPRSVQAAAKAEGFGPDVLRGYFREFKELEEQIKALGRRASGPSEPVTRVVSKLVEGERRPVKVPFADVPQRFVEANNFATERKIRVNEIMFDRPEYLAGLRKFLGLVELYGQLDWKCADLALETLGLRLSLEEHPSAADLDSEDKLRNKRREQFLALSQCLKTAYGELALRKSASEQLRLDQAANKIHPTAKARLLEPPELTQYQVYRDALHATIDALTDSEKIDFILLNFTRIVKLLKVSTTSYYQYHLQQGIPNEFFASDHFPSRIEIAIGDDEFQSNALLQSANKVYRAETGQARNRRVI